MKLKLPVLIVFILFSASCFSQSWLKEMQKDDRNFYAIKKKADKYFKDEIRLMKYQSKHAATTVPAGEEDEGVEGYKIYKRWEEFWKPRVNADGTFPPPDAVYNEMIAWNKKYNSNKFQTQGTWTPAGPFTVATGGGWSPGIGRINGMTANPQNANDVYACAPAGGLWKSTTGGNNFTTTTDGLPSIGFTSVVVDYTNPNIVYATSGDGEAGDTYGLGVLKSTDAGATWNTTGLKWSILKFRQTHKIIMDPVNPNILLVGTSNGLMRSTDGAATWTIALNANILDIEWKPGNSSIVYASSENSFYRSTDNGQTFIAIGAGLPGTMAVNRLAIAVTAANNDYVYIIAGASSDNGFYGLYRSTDAGLNFNFRNNQPNVMGWDIDGTDAGGQSWYTLSLAADPVDAEHILTGGVNVWESFDGGLSYTINAHWLINPGNYVHADIHFLDFCGNILYAGTDGGLFKSTNFAATWTNVSGGLQVSQFYRMAGSEGNPSMILAGAQDNGGIRLTGGTWDQWLGADGFEQAINPSNSNLIYGESQNGNLYKSANGGASHANIGGSISGSADWNAPFLLNNTGTLYVGRQDIWRSTNNGLSFTKITTSSMPTLKFMALCKSAQNIMYATDGGSVYKIDVTTGNVNNVTNGLSGAKSYVAVADNNPDKVYVTISGFTKGRKVYSSSDGGLTWANISGNLPNIPATTITCDNTALEGIYTGTDAGVFYRNNNSNNWQLFMSGLPNVIVDEMEINYATGKIRAATYGRGMWESPLYVESIPVVNFTEDRRYICPNLTVTFTDVSTEGPTTRSWSFPGGNPATATAQTVTVTYPSTGNYDVTLTAGNAAGSATITKTQHILVNNNLQPLPVVEGFESGVLPAAWRIEDLDNDLFTWQMTDSGGFGNSAHSYKCINFDADNSGAIDNLVLPQYDLTTIVNPTLSFDVAYARRSGGSTDTLKVQASTDCGNTWITLYAKSGNALKTTTIFYPTAFVPDATQWRKEVISLALLATQNQVLFRFENVSKLGNNVFIDNINIDVATAINELISSPVTVTVLPDPVNDVSQLTVNINSKNPGFFQLNIYNALGQHVKSILSSAKGVRNFELKKSDFNSGVFMFELVDGKNSIFKGKFVVE